MVSNTQFFIFLIIILFSSCNEKTTPIQHSQKPNFSDLNHIHYPDLKLFENIPSLPTEVNTNNSFRDYNSILYLCEATNIPPIERENLQKILPKEEFEEYLQNYCEPRLDSLICQKEYFAFGRIVTDKFVLLNLNTRETTGREYTFEFRTYTLEGEFITKVEYAKWNYYNKMFFWGRLNANMQIEVFGDKQNIAAETYTIEDNGEMHLK